MSVLTSKDSGREMDDLQDRWARFFCLVPVPVASGGEEATTAAERARSVDISEDDKEWLAEADLLRR